MLDQLGEGPRLCLAAMLDHLSRFRLDSILRATASFAPARLQFRMSLPASTLTNLEVFVTSSGQEKGSLFSIINRTQTQFGRCGTARRCRIPADIPSGVCYASGSARR